MRISWKLVSTVLIAVLVVAFFALMAFGLANRSPATGRSGETRVGKPAPSFSMPLLGGGQFSSEDHLGSPMIINFWASWCPPCRVESPGFERVWQTVSEGQGIQLVGVDIQDTEEEALAYVYGSSDSPFRTGRDTDGKITIEYGVIGLPVTFFVSADGVVEGRWVGALPEDRLESWTQALISGSTPGGETEGEAEEGFFKLR